MPIYFLKVLCNSMVGFLLFFWYNCPTFENHISCNELILLIVIQKNVPSLPTTIRGITNPEEANSTGLAAAAGQKAGGKETDVAQGVAGLSGSGCCLGGERQRPQHAQQQPGALQPRFLTPAPVGSLGVVEVLQQGPPPLLCYVHLVF